MAVTGTKEGDYIKDCLHKVASTRQVAVQNSDRKRRILLNTQFSFLN